MNKSVFRWHSILLTFFAPLVCFSETPQKTPTHHSSSNANLLLITIDTLRADHLGCYGYKNAHTPTVDGLAHDGVRFETAYSVVPTTLPSHATIMTGSYPMKTGMHDFSGNRLSPSEPTLAKVLHEKHYETAAIIGAAVLDHRFGLDSGFDYYYDHFDFSRLDEANLDAMERPANLVADEALAWLKKKKTGNFLLWVHLYDPHYPYNPPPPYDKEFRTLPYDGEIAFADAQLGRIIQYLKNKGVYDNTVIAVAGDHGEGLGEHGEKTHGFFIYDSTMHVPLIIKPASSRKKGRPNQVVHSPVSLVDVMPTLLEEVNAVPPPGIEGRSLLPLISGRSESESELYSETYLPRLHFDWSELRGLRRQQYHFIDGPKPELYDLAADPHELRNLHMERQAVSTELRGILATIVKENTPDANTAEKTSLDPAMMERLKSLGYAAVSGGVDATISNRELPDPKDRIQVYELVAEAIEASQHGRLDQSIAKLQEALLTEKASVPIHYLLALDFYKKQAYPEAAQEFSWVLDTSPNYALAAFYLGLSQARVGDWEASIRALQRALDLDHTNFTAAMNLGFAYVQKRMFDEAVTAFRESITINPDYAQGHKALGQLQLYLGNVGAAVQSLERAEALNPSDPQTHAELARAYDAQGEMRKAAEERLKTQPRNIP